MIPAASEVERFRAAITRRLGLAFDETKLGLLAEVLQRRVEASEARAVGEYLLQLESDDPRRDELRQLARELTIPETYFFRYGDQFRAFAEVALANRIAARSSVRRLRVLSAGCASGEEPYSLAIVLREQLAVAGWDVSVRAVDVNPAALERAARGRYTSWSLRETLPDRQRRWFSAEGRELVLDETIRAAVTFEERNLTVEDAELWAPSQYDVVFCRNVIMYFTPEHARAVLARVTRALAPGGYLFLGHAETLRGLSSDYHLLHTHGTFYYERREGGAEERHPSPGPSSAAAVHQELGPAGDGAASWVDAIRGATERIQLLAERPPAPSEPANVAPMQHALELLERERYMEALEQFHAIPARHARDPDVLILRAVLLTHSGQFGAARAVCEELLAIDELNAGAHYLLALCREGFGDPASAAHHHQLASYLDPAFAMARLHLGLIARRAGELEVARRDLGQALVLLQREDASRLLLYGGGFSRDALVALCRAELVASGGRS